MWKVPGIVGNAVTLKVNDHASVIIQAGAWVTGPFTDVTVQQDTSVIPTVNAKQLVFTKYWTNEAAVGSNTFVETASPTGAFVVGTAYATYIIEIDGDELDATREFDCIRLLLGVVFNAQQEHMIAGEYVLSKPRYAGASASGMNVRVD